MIPLYRDFTDRAQIDAQYNPAALRHPGAAGARHGPTLAEMPDGHLARCLADVLA